MPRAVDLLVPEDLPPLEPDEDSSELSDDELGVLLDELPDADEGEAGAEGESRDSELDLLEATDDGTPPGEGEDSAEASDLDVGGDTEDSMLVEESGYDDDSAATIDIEGDDALEPASALDPADDAEGTLEPLSSWLDAELPPLELADDAEGVAAADELHWAAGFDDDPRPPLIAEPWRESCPTLALEACSALATRDGITVAGSTDLLWFALGTLSPLRLDAGSARILALALVGSGWEYAICATVSGRLIRRGRVSPASEELRRSRDAPEGVQSAREIVELCQPGASFPHALLARSSQGQLLRSDDDGASFRRVGERRVVGLAPHGAPALALTHDGRLLRSDDGGGSFSELALPAAVQPLLQADGGITLSAHGDVFVLAEESAGVALSSDGGRSFRRIPGLRGVTAIAATPTCAFAALYDEVEDCSFVVRIEVTTGSAETLALIPGEGCEEDDPVEWARVARLEWDAVARRLWLVGGFGVKALEAPLSDTAWPTRPVA